MILWYDSSYNFDPQLPRSWHGLHELLHRVQLQHHPRVLQDRWGHICNCSVLVTVCDAKISALLTFTDQDALSLNVCSGQTLRRYISILPRLQYALVRVRCRTVCIYYSLQSLSGIWRGSRRRSRQLLTRDTSELHNIFKSQARSGDGLF